jgi:hypothetical protein
MIEAKSPSRLAAEFVRNNPLLVERSGVSESEVLGYVAECLALKRRVHLWGLAPELIITPVGGYGFADSPVGKLFAEIRKFVQSISGDAIGEAL